MEALPSSRVEDPCLLSYFASRYGLSACVVTDYLFSTVYSIYHGFPESFAGIPDSDIWIQMVQEIRNYFDGTDFYNGKTFIESTQSLDSQNRGVLVLVTGTVELMVSFWNLQLWPP